MLWAFVTFISALAIALASPGPAFIAISHTALNHSKRDAFMFGIGLASIATLWCGIGFFGLALIFKLVPLLYTTLKIAGGFYLIYLAIKIWRGATLPLSTANTAPKKGSRFYLAGCMINITNPKSALFAGSVLLAIFPIDMAIGYKLLAMAIMFTVEATFYSMIVLWLSQPKIRQAYMNAKKWIDRSCGILLGSLGLGLILKR